MKERRYLMSVSKVFTKKDICLVKYSIFVVEVDKAD